MNIFYLHPVPDVAAKYMCDKHVVKMILETAQLLSTAHHHYGSSTPIMYKPTHKNHPCAVWVRECWHNYHWAYDHLQALCHQYRIRYNKRHKTEALLDDLLKLPRGIPMRDINTVPPQCMPEQYKHHGPDRQQQTVNAYRDYYINDKSRFATWKTQTPKWFKLASAAESRAS